MVLTRHQYELQPTADDVQMDGDKDHRVSGALEDGGIAQEAADPWSIFAWEHRQLRIWMRHYQAVCRAFPDRHPVTAEDGSQVLEQTLPNRLCLRRRFLDFYFSSHVLASLTEEESSTSSLSNPASSSPPFTGPNHYMWAIEKFRDCLPHLVLVVHADGASVMLEPGKLGPFPWAHPLVRALVDGANARRLPSNLALLLKRHQVPLYDGGCILGILDYRLSASSSASIFTPLGPSNASGTGNNRRPAVHKVYLRPTHASMLAGLVEEDPLEAGRDSEDDGVIRQPFNEDTCRVEQRLLLELNPNMYLDRAAPAFFVDIPGSLLFEDLKSRSYSLPPYAIEAILGTGASSSASSAITERSRRGGSSQQIPANKLRRLAVIEDYRQGKLTSSGDVATASASHPYVGPNPSSNVAGLGELIPTTEHVLVAYKNNQPPPTGPEHLPPTATLWRSLRWEKLFSPEPRHGQTAASSPASSSASPLVEHHFWTVNVYCQFNHRLQLFEYPMVVWKSVNRADYYVPSRGTFLLRHTFRALPLLEQWLLQLKRLLALEDATRRSLGEVVNPGALRASTAVPATTASMGSKRTSSASATPLPGGSPGASSGGSKKGRKRKNPDDPVRS